MGHRMQEQQFCFSANDLQLQSYANVRQTDYSCSKSLGRIDDLQFSPDPCTSDSASCSDVLEFAVPYLLFAECDSYDNGVQQSRENDPEYLRAITEQLFNYVATHFPQNFETSSQQSIDFLLEKPRIESAYLLENDSLQDCAQLNDCGGLDEQPLPQFIQSDSVLHAPTLMQELGYYVNELALPTSRVSLIRSRFRTTHLPAVQFDMFSENHCPEFTRSQAMLSVNDPVLATPGQQNTVNDDSYGTMQSNLVGSLDWQSQGGLGFLHLDNAFQNSCQSLRTANVCGTNANNNQLLSIALLSGNQDAWQYYDQATTLNRRRTLQECNRVKFRILAVSVRRSDLHGIHSTPASLNAKRRRCHHSVQATELTTMHLELSQTVLLFSNQMRPAKSDDQADVHKDPMIRCLLASCQVPMPHKNGKLSRWRKKRRRNASAALSDSTVKSTGNSCEVIDHLGTASCSDDCELLRCATPVQAESPIVDVDCQDASQLMASSPALQATVPVESMESVGLENAGPACSLSQNPHIESLSPVSVDCPTETAPVRSLLLSGNSEPSSSNDAMSLDEKLSETNVNAESMTCGQLQLQMIDESVVSECNRSVDPSKLKNTNHAMANEAMSPNESEMRSTTPKLCNMDQEITPANDMYSTPQNATGLDDTLFERPGQLQHLVQANESVVAKKTKSLGNASNMRNPLPDRNATVNQAEPSCPGTVKCSVWLSNVGVPMEESVALDNDSGILSVSSSTVTTCKSQGETGSPKDATKPKDLAESSNTSRFNAADALQAAKRSSPLLRSPRTKEHSNQSRPSSGSFGHAGQAPAWESFAEAQLNYLRSQTDLLLDTISSVPSSENLHTSISLNSSLHTLCGSSTRSSSVANLTQLLTTDSLRAQKAAIDAERRRMEVEMARTRALVEQAKFSIASIQKDIRKSGVRPSYLKKKLAEVREKFLLESENERRWQEQHSESFETINSGWTAASRPVKCVDWAVTRPPETGTQRTPLLEVNKVPKVTLNGRSNPPVNLDNEILPSRVRFREALKQFEDPINEELEYLRRRFRTSKFVL